MFGVDLEQTEVARFTQCCKLNLIIHVNFMQLLVYCIHLQTCFIILGPSLVTLIVRKEVKLSVRIFEVFFGAEI